MNHTGLFSWPALSCYSGGIRSLIFERAIFGKVSGQRSDYRWIGRTQAFMGHTWDIHRRLSIGSEDEPRKTTLWYSDKEHDRCYAAFCYPSLARDANGRSGFLEKQILEWRKDKLTSTAVAALVLLREIGSKDAYESIAHADDPRWEDPNFCLTLPETRKEYSKYDVESIIADGLGALRRVEEDALVEFYASLEHRHSHNSSHIAPGTDSPAFLRIDGSLTPEGLAVLLLPIEENKLASMSIAGGLPVRRVDEIYLRSWTGIACQRDQVRDLPSLSLRLEETALAKMIVSSLRAGAYPRTAPLLEFAIGDERWRGPLSLSQPTPLTDSEVRVVEDARELVMKQIAATPPWKDEALLDARRRHLRSKADVILAAVIEDFPAAFKNYAESRQASFVSEIRQIWSSTSAQQ